MFSLMFVGSLTARGVVDVFADVCWLLDVIRKWQCISGTDLPRQLCHTETEPSNPTCRLTQSHHTGTGPTSPCTDFVTPGAGVMEADDRQVTTIFTV